MSPARRGGDAQQDRQALTVARLGQIVMANFESSRPEAGVWPLGTDVGESLRLALRAISFFRTVRREFQNGHNPQQAKSLRRHDASTSSVEPVQQKRA